LQSLPPSIPTQKPILAKRAYIGILAVLLAAINSSLGAGLIGVGLQDLRGAWGLGIDDACYIPTAFNASQMFMGPLTIVLGARFGHRKVLLHAGCIYILSSLLLPFAPRTPIVLLLLIISGLASGTFYPLCLSFITRSLPVRLLSYGAAAYGMDLLAGNHFVQSMEGFFLDHMSWHWIFWNQAICTLPMLFCVYFGIPATPKEQLLPRASYGEVLYVSAGLTMLYIALDQGERLDWFNNGLINGLIISGVLLLIVAVIRRWINPYPYLDFSYLKKRNILIIALALVGFRIILLRAGAIIPIFLETVHQYRPPEIGSMLLFSTLPYLFALPLTAWLLVRVHVRYVLFIGFTALALVCFYDAHTLSTWIGADFLVQQLIGAVAICMAVTGVFAGNIFEGRLTGAYRNRAGAYVQGVYFQAVRLFGTEISDSAFRRFVHVRQHFWQTKLVSGLGSSWQFDDRIAHLSIALAPQAAGPLQRPEIATGLIAKAVENQAFTLAIDDSFMVLSLVAIVCVVAVAVMTPIPLPHQLPGADEAPPS